MRPSSTLAAALLLALLAACSAGSGPATQLPGGQREPGGPGQEPAATGPDPAPGGRESPGGGGGSGGGSEDAGPGSCPTCDFVYTCTAAGQAQSADIDLVSSDGKCFFGSPGDKTVFSCDGTISGKTTDASGHVTDVTIPWTATGGGGFQFVANGLGVTCVPKGPLVQQTPAPSGG